MKDNIEKEEYINKREFGEDRTNVGYALYVRDKIKEGDYFRTITGEIFQAIGKARGNRVYYVAGEYYWVDVIAIVNFNSNVLELIENGDIVEYKQNNITKSDKIVRVKEYTDARSFKEYLGVEGFRLEQVKIISILTKEQYKVNCYKLEV